MFNVAHGATGGEAPIVRIESGEQWVKWIVQKSLFARITVVETFRVGTLIISQRLPRIE